jgi:hypothetical protein
MLPGVRIRRMAIHASKTPDGKDRGDYRDVHQQYACLEVQAGASPTIILGLVSIPYLELDQTTAGDLGTLLTNFAATGTFDPPPP